MSTFLRYFFLIFILFNFNSKSIAQSYTYSIKEVDSLVTLSTKKTNISEKLNLLLQASVIMEEKGTKSSKYLFYLNMGIFYAEQSLYDKAISELEQITSPSLVNEILFYQTYAKALSSSGKYLLAISNYKLLLSLYQHQNNLVEQANVYIFLAETNLKLNNYDQAIENELDNLKIRTQLRDTSSMATALNNLGAISKFKKNYTNALNYFQKSYTLQLTSKNFDKKAILLFNIGFIYQLLQDYENSVRYLDKSLQTFIGLNNWAEAARCYNTLAVVLFLQKDKKQSILFAQKAIEASQKVKSYENLIQSYKLLTRIYRKSNHTELALSYFQLYVAAQDSLELKQKNKVDELIKRTNEFEKNELYIRNLLIDKELKDLEIKRLSLFNENKSKELQIIQRDRKLNDFDVAQKQLQTQQDLQLLKLEQQKLLLEKKSLEIKNKEKEVVYLQIQKNFSAKEKQNKIDSLHHRAEIDQLIIKDAESQLYTQSLIRNGLYLLIPILILLVYLYFNRIKIKQEVNATKMERLVLETEQQLLRVQMNPHFMFNALNSIQFYVSTNNSYEAVKYLAKFAKLMRNILEYSRLPLISVSEEVDSLTLYLELEKLRFENKFDFKVIVDENLESDYIGIPPMLTQPFLENSILHGIGYKEGIGLIEIIFKIEGEHLVCIIQDDGVGREKAAKLKLTKKGKHKSAGMKITTDRINLLNSQFKNKFSYAIEDLYDSNQNSLGTKVILQMGVIPI